MVKRASPVFILQVGGVQQLVEQNVLVGVRRRYRLAYGHANGTVFSETDMAMSM